MEDTKIDVIKRRVVLVVRVEKEQKGEEQKGEEQKGEEQKGEEQKGEEQKGEKNLVEKEPNAPKKYIKKRDNVFI